MALYRGSVKVSGIGNSVPTSGNVGDVLTKTNGGYEFQEIPKELPTTGNVGDVLTKTADGVDFLAPQGGTQDYLGVEGLVGENYTLSNTLFRQTTPKSSNCSIEANVGDVANNTQIHIQRIGSGTASDELKLYVKKVGTPGDLSVQIMEGVKVDVSTTEAYWYGNSSNILATGTISSSDITSSFEEITVSLSSSVGGTEGELLDIVLSIPTVNASNYVVIGCDGTQWGEAFSYVAVNGTTRTRNKLMPFCISDGFSEALLVKSQTTALMGSLPITASVYTGSSATQYRTVYTATKASDNCKLTWYYTGSSGSVAVKKNSTTIGSSGDGSANLSLAVNDQIKVEFSTPGSGITIHFSLTEELIGPNREYKGVPRSSTVKSIGELETITIFGVHDDNTFKNFLTPSSTGGFLKYCKAYGTAHSKSTTNYTMIGYGYVQRWIKTGNGDNLPAVNINGIRINQNGYNTSYFRLTEGFYTVEPGDVITSGSNVTVVDYY